LLRTTVLHPFLLSRSDCGRLTRVRSQAVALANGVRMHLTISNQTEDDLRFTFGSYEEKAHAVVKAHAKSTIVSKCSLLVISRHPRNKETKEHESIYTSSVSVHVPLQGANIGRRWEFVKVPEDSEWIIYRDKVRQLL